jgi:hypothetical protein
MTTDAATVKITWDGQEDYITIVKVREGIDGSDGVDGADGADGITYNIDIESTNGNIFRPGQGSATILIAHVYRNGVDITDELPGSAFQWRRVSYKDPEPPNNDAAWNSLYQSGYKQVMVTTDSIMDRATYHCNILI